MAMKRFCFIGTVNVELLMPVTWENKEIKTVALDFSKLNGKMINWCEAKTWASGNVSKAAPSTSSEYCTRLASCISDLPYKDDWDARYRIFEKMGFHDCDAIFQTVSSFFLQRNPQKFYDQFVKANYDEEEDAYTDDDEKGDSEGFTEPVEQPEESNTQTS